jgi:hypothetical protein
VTTTKTNFLGIPVAGDINKGDKRTPQKPLSELEPLIRAVIDDPTIKAFGWTQYTPYFNDGEPCTFGVHGAWFLTVDDPDVDDVEEFYTYELDCTDHPSLGKVETEWAGRWPNREIVSETYEGPDEERYRRTKALSDAIIAGAFEDVLLEAFGDHAEVRVQATGITVDTYEHD